MPAAQQQDYWRIYPAEAYANGLFFAFFLRDTVGDPTATQLGWMPLFQSLTKFYRDHRDLYHGVVASSVRSDHLFEHAVDDCGQRPGVAAAAAGSPGESRLRRRLERTRRLHRHRAAAGRADVGHARVARLGRRHRRSPRRRTRQGTSPSRSRRWSPTTSSKSRTDGRVHATGRRLSPKTAWYPRCVVLPAPYRRPGRDGTRSPVAARGIRSGSSKRASSAGREGRAPRGVIVQMTPRGIGHAAAIERLTHLFVLRTLAAAPGFAFSCLTRLGHFGARARPGRRPARRPRGFAIRRALLVDRGGRLIARQRPAREDAGFMLRPASRSIGLSTWRGGRLRSGSDPARMATRSCASLGPAKRSDLQAFPDVEIAVSDIVRVSAVDALTASSARCGRPRPGRRRSLRTSPRTGWGGGGRRPGRRAPSPPTSSPATSRR